LINYYGRPWVGMSKYIELWSTFIPDETSSLVNEVLESGWLNTGEKERLLREELKRKFNLPYCVATNSGTAALRASYAALGIGPGDEVISTPYTFIATNTAILEQGAIPVFADIQYDTLNIDPDKIAEKITDRTKAIVCVHYGGNPCDMDRIRQIGKDFSLPVVEDSAHALASKYKGDYVGSKGDVVCFSLQAIKVITSADGGVVSTNNEELYNRIQQLSWYGIDRSKRDPKSIDPLPDSIDNLGFKSNLNDIAAAMGLAGLRNVGDALESRRRIGEAYRDQLSDCSRVRLLNYSKDVTPNYQIFPVHVEDRQRFAQHMESRNIQVRLNNRRNDRYSIFGGLKELPSTERADKDTIIIPVHAGMNSEDCDRVIDAVRGYDKL